MLSACSQPRRPARRNRGRRLRAEQSRQHRRSARPTRSRREEAMLRWDTRPYSPVQHANANNLWIDAVVTGSAVGRVEDDRTGPVSKRRKQLPLANPQQHGRSERPVWQPSRVPRGNHHRDHRSMTETATTSGRSASLNRSVVGMCVDIIGVAGAEGAEFAWRAGRTAPTLMTGSAGVTCRRPPGDAFLCRPCCSSHSNDTGLSMLRLLAAAPERS
jgi:hypothetical protein